jgi:hypothetical protein
MRTLIYTFRFQTTKTNAFALLDYIRQHPTANALLTFPERQEIDDLIRAVLPGSSLRCDSALEIDPRLFNRIG